jgi:hypothetical protein
MTAHRRIRGSCTRRQLLGFGAGVAFSAVAGCTSLSERVADHYVGDVNIFNTVEIRFTGQLEVLGPDNRLVLEELLAVTPESGDKPAVIYEDVLDVAGKHRVHLDVDATPETESQTVRETVSIADPSETHIVVFLGRELTGELVTVRAVEDFEELEGDIESD